MFVTFQACRRRFKKKTRLFWKGTFWGPQAMFATFQACRKHLFSFNDMPFWRKTCSCQTLTMFVNIWSIFVQYLSIFVNVWYWVRTYLLYGIVFGSNLGFYCFYFIFIRFTHRRWICNGWNIYNAFVKCRFHRFVDLLGNLTFKSGLLFLTNIALFSNL